MTTSYDRRPVSWVKLARKAFETFPVRVQERALQALGLAAEGQKAAIAKPMKGLGRGVFEIVLRYRGDAYRVAYAVQLGDEIWVLHAFQKKAKRGIATPTEDINLVPQRLKRVKEQIE